MSHYIVRVSTAPVKGKARHYGPWIRLAVIEVPDGVKSVPAIDIRGRNVLRIVRTWGFRRALYDGRTMRSAGKAAIAEAKDLARKLNRRKAREALRAFDPAI